jgi:hypothetical protein
MYFFFILQNVVPTNLTDLVYMRYQAFITRHWLSARGCMVERLQAFVGYVMKWKESGGRGSSWARVSEYERRGTTSFMTSRVLRYSPTLSQSCNGHKVNIRHQRAARVTAFPVSILPHPSLPTTCLHVPLERRVTRSRSWDLRDLYSDFTSVQKSLNMFYLMD